MGNDAELADEHQSQQPLWQPPLLKFLEERAAQLHPKAAELIHPIIMAGMVLGFALIGIWGKAPSSVDRGQNREIRRKRNPLRRFNFSTDVHEA